MEKISSSLESGAEENPTRRRLEFIKRGYGNVERLFRVGDYETSGSSGTISNALDRPDDKRPMIVRTDSGAIVPEQRELITERLSGCVGLFIQGPTFRYLVHMPPSGNLGYYYYRFHDSREMVRNNVARVLGELPPGAPKETISAMIVANIPNETDGPYGRQKLTAAWEVLRDEIKSSGIENVRAVELPLDETMVYFPASSDIAYAVGTNTEIGPDGNYVFHPGETREQIIDFKDARRMETGQPSTKF